MIRWTEHRDRYRVDVSFGWMHRLRALGGLWLLMSSGLVAIHYFRGSRGSNAPLCFSLGLLTLAILVMIALDLLRRGREYGEAWAWIEVPTQGGRARWGGPRHDPSTEELPVTRFEVVHGSGGCGGVDALLLEGRRVRIFGPWGALHSLPAEKIVEELNACLRAGEGPVATPDIVPGGVQLVPEQGSTDQTVPWKDGTGPYRATFRRMDRAAWGMAFPAAMILLLNHPRMIAIPSGWIPLLSGLFGAYALGLTWWFWRDALWIEVTRRGGAIRWGLRDEEWSRVPVVVARFAVGVDITPWEKRYPRFFPVAILPDGSHVRPLRHFRTWVKGPVWRKVAALNAALVSEGSR